MEQNQACRRRLLVLKTGHAEKKSLFTKMCPESTFSRQTLPWFSWTQNMLHVLFCGRFVVFLWLILRDSTWSQTGGAGAARDVSEEVVSLKCPEKHLQLSSGCSISSSEDLSDKGHFNFQ